MLKNFTPNHFLATVIVAGHMFLGGLSAYAELPQRWTSTIESGSDYTTVLKLNGDFESLSAGKPTGWNTKTENENSWKLSAEAAYEGNGGMQLNLSAPEETVPTLSSSIFSVKEGDAIAFYLWAKSSTAVKSRLFVGVQINREGKWSNIEPRLSATASTSWREFGGVPAFIPHGVTQARIVVSGQRVKSPLAWDIDNLAVWKTSFSRYAEKQKDKTALQNFLLLGIDTLRQNRLGCYGASRLHTPAFDGIAKEGHLYEEVTSTCPWTPPSWASIFTSLYPTQHKAEFRVAPIAKEAKTLPEILREHGYFTVGIVTSGDLDGLLGEKKDFQRGFDIYFQHGDTRHVGEALSHYLDYNAQALQEFKTGGLFIFWHCYDPHLHYLNRFPDLVRNQGGELGTIDIHDSIIVEYAAGKPIKEADLTYINDVYNSEVVYTDQWVRNFQIRLQHLGLWDDLNVVLCSDHGEAFNENGRWKHSLTYETMVRTPLLIRLPERFESGKRVDDVLVSNLDIMPTLLEVAGIESPSYVEGRSLLDPQPEAHTAKVGISESKLEGWLSLRDKRYKLVVSDATNKRHLPREEIQNPAKVVWTIFTEKSEAKFHLYDLSKDPKELHDLAKEEPAILSRLKSMLKAHMERTRASAFEAREQIIESQETEEALQALGYL